MMSRTKKYTDDELLTHLRKLADDGTRPVEDEIDRSDGPWSSTYRYRFGSLAEAASAAGLEPLDQGQRGRAKEYSREELLDHLRKLADDGTQPTQDEIDESDGPCQATYQQRFSSLSEAAEEAGLEPVGQGRREQYTDDELLSHLRKLADDGTQPTQDEIDESDGASSSTYQQRFGSLSGAAEAAGLEPAEAAKRGRGKRYPDEELLSWIDAYVREFSAVPSSEEARHWPGPSLSTFRLHFGGWREAVRRAGYEPRGRAGGSHE